jgi:hypothetical protein
MTGVFVAAFGPVSLALLKKGAQAIVRKGFYFVIIAAGHVVVIDQGVDDSFFGRFDSGSE